MPILNSSCVLVFFLPVILSWTSKLVFSSSRRTLHQAPISSKSAWPMMFGRTPSLLSACMWGSCETRPSTIQGLSAWQVWSTTHARTHLRGKGFPSLGHLTAVLFRVCKLQFSRKETEADPPSVIYVPTSKSELWKNAFKKAADNR